MLNYTTKKKSKLNTYKAVRENINLNSNKNAVFDLTKNLVSDEFLIFQLSEINAINHLQTQNLNKKGKIVVKWWEN
jgi:hypothetical protein